VCRPLLRLYRPFTIFEGCLDSNTECCRIANPYLPCRPEYLILLFMTDGQDLFSKTTEYAAPVCNIGLTLSFDMQHYYKTLQDFTEGVFLYVIGTTIFFCIAFCRKGKTKVECPEATRLCPKTSTKYFHEFYLKKVFAL
jgi:hypothetical protein